MKKLTPVFIILILLSGGSCTGLTEEVAQQEAQAGVHLLIRRLKIKREHIRKKTWVSSSTTFFDDNWKVEEAVQAIAFYDYNNPGRFRNFRGKVYVGVLNGQPDFDNKVEVSFNYRNAERGRQKFYAELDRCSMMEQATQNGGQGLRNGWRVQRAAGLNWYLKWTVYP